MFLSSSLSVRISGCVQFASHFAHMTALASTGVIWARYSTQIIPVNYNLMAVNLFVGGTGIYQLVRLFLHHRKHVE